MEKSWDQDPDPHNKSSGSETLIMQCSLFNLHFRLELYNVVRLQIAFFNTPSSSHSNHRIHFLQGKPEELVHGGVVQDGLPGPGAQPHAEDRRHSQQKAVHWRSYEIMDESLWEAFKPIKICNVMSVSTYNSVPPFVFTFLWYVYFSRLFLNFFILFILFKVGRSSSLVVQPGSIPVVPKQWN